VTDKNTPTSHKGDKGVEQDRGLKSSGHLETNGQRRVCSCSCESGDSVTHPKCDKCDLDTITCKHNYISINSTTSLDFSSDIVKMPELKPVLSSYSTVFKDFEYPPKRDVDHRIELSDPK